MNKKYNMIMNLDAIVEFQETSKARLDCYLELSYLFEFLNGSIVNNELKIPIYYNKRTIYDNGHIYNDKILNSFVTITLTRDMVEYLKTLSRKTNNTKSETIVDKQIKDASPNDEDNDVKNSSTQVLDVLWGDTEVNDIVVNNEGEAINFIHVQGLMINNDLGLIFVENLSLGEIINFNSEDEISEEILIWRVYKTSDNLDELLITGQDYARAQAILDAQEEALYQEELAEIKEELQAIIEAPIDEDDANIAEIYTQFTTRHLAFYQKHSYMIYVLYGLIIGLIITCMITATI